MIEKALRDVRLRNSTRANLHFPSRGRERGAAAALRVGYGKASENWLWRGTRVPLSIFFGTAASNAALWTRQADLFQRSHVNNCKDFSWKWIERYRWKLYYNRSQHNIVGNPLLIMMRDKLIAVHPRCNPCTSVRTVIQFPAGNRPWPC